MIIEYWVEPLAYEQGLNLYEEGANQAMANMLFVCLNVFWGKSFRQQLLQSFQHMFRARTPERFSECRTLLEKTIRTTDDAGNREILSYLFAPFVQLGMDHLKDLPVRVLDLAVPGLVALGQYWRQSGVGPWNVVHDQSSNMAKQQGLWDAYSSSSLPDAVFYYGDTLAVYPMNVSSTRFGNSKTEKQLQICDLLAGAMSAYARALTDPVCRSAYTDNLHAAGISTLIGGSIWPTSEVSPEGLGKQGQDGNLALEWLGKHVRHPS
jgi:hypothetical protein